MMSPLTFFRILKGLKVHFNSKWICFNSNHIVIFNIIQLSSSRMLYLLLMMLFLDHLDPFLNLRPG
jgi:hypothetical protein